MSTKLRFGVVLALMASLFSAAIVASAQDTNNDYDDNGYFEIATDEFYNVWKRTDKPVAEGKVHRTWIWGPGAISDLIEEQYVEGEGGTRMVQYFEKSRMELPTDTVDKDSAWYITQGRLAYELMTGNIQLGDNDFYANGPSQRSAAGDYNDTTAPTYAVMGELMDLHARDTGGVITQFVDRHGNISDNHDYKHYGVTDYKYDAVTDHNIASVFWKFMNSTGIVYDHGHHKAVSNHLFENPYYAVGRPLTEAYWAHVTVAGVEQDVLIQCFERRCLTFTPGNPEGWEVESGNIGQHYYDWRYIEKGGVTDDTDDGIVDDTDDGIVDDTDDGIVDDTEDGIVDDTDDGIVDDDDNGIIDDDDNGIVDDDIDDIDDDLDDDLDDGLDDDDFDDIIDDGEDDSDDSD
jgi:hypothetical protein